MSDYWEMIQRHEREMKLKEEAARLVARALLQKQEEEKKAAEWRCLQEAAARAAQKEAKRKRMERSYLAVRPIFDAIHRNAVQIRQARQSAIEVRYDSSYDYEEIPVRLKWGDKLQATDEEKAIVANYYIRRPGFRLARSIPETILAADYAMIWVDIVYDGSDVHRNHPYDWDRRFYVDDIVDRPEIVIPTLSAQLKNPHRYRSVLKKGQDYWLDRYPDPPYVEPERP